MSRYKICVSVAAFLCVFLSVFGAPETSAVRNPAYVAYIDKWKATALAQQVQYGIPASITLAQGLLESGAGQSDLATTANNHFGIKCHSDWQGGTFRKDDDKRDECFRSYQNADDSFRDHSLFLKRKRYEVLFTYDVNDYKAWANGLKACGYATDPSYPQKLIRIIETYDLANLGKASVKPDKKEKTSKPEVTAQNGKSATRPRQNSDSPPERPRQNPDKTSTKSNKTTKPVKPSKPTQPQVQQASADTVVWRPAQFRTNKLYSEHAYGKTNGRKFIVAQEGDTWGSIAYTLGMEEKTLRRINEATDKQTLRGGDRIYLFPKRSKADKRNTRHLVQPGETAWDIAQHYGMKMSSLYKINGIPEGTPLKTQQWINLR
ncbi:MAG: glucosaminidase domain-containing protein [Paludibacteraceae bacterium]|nr:glucosaminidase domain-containing protein [Paludibacteraceae bacterium]